MVHYSGAARFCALVDSDIKCFRDQTKSSFIMMNKSCFINFSANARTVVHFSRQVKVPTVTVNVILDANDGTDSESAKFNCRCNC